MKRTWIHLKCLLLCAALGQSLPNAALAREYQPGQTAAESRAQWQKLTEGEDLARGKKVQFYTPPNYRLTTDDNDPYDLTDGQLSSREDDRVWFNQDAVGWYQGIGITNGVLMVIDLGSPQPVGQIAIRVLGGHEQGSLDLPNSAQFLASLDGERYHTLQSMVKLNPAEREQADGKTGYYVPEEGRAFMYPLVCREAVTARYVAIRVTPLNSLFTDQISVLKAESSTALKDLASFPEAQVFTDGIAVVPRHTPFTVTTNIATPNWLTISDNSQLDPKNGKLAFRITLPTGLAVLPSSQPEFKKIDSTPDSNTWEFAYDGKNRQGSVGPLWIVKKGAVASGAKATLAGVVDGKPSHVLQYPIDLVAIPETRPIEGLDVSLAWMHEATQQNWPDFFRDFRKMGFNHVSTFPRYFGKQNSDGSWSEKTGQKLAFLEQARAEGYGIVYNESPFHVMWNKIQADQKRGKIDEAEAEQLFTQIDGKRGEWMNIIYRGKYFQDEIQRIAHLAATVQPDHAYLDIEWWRASVIESKKDPRVVAAWKKSGKDWDGFVTDMGKTVLGELVATMRKAVPERQVTVGLYNSDPKNAIYNSIFAFDKIYPDIIDLAQPSLYVQGRAEIVAERIRHDYEQMQARQIIPWLSTGTYGEHDPKLVEPMVLEAILNGSRGLTYYWFGDFDPMDFYHHSKALKSLAPHQSLLQNGKPVEYSGSNGSLHYTAFASKDEALVLVENFAGTSDIQTDLALPVAGISKVVVDGKALPIKDGSVSIAVPPKEFRLVHFGK